ncbi:hypothetical protein NDU88_001854 [Pleurodeles waltl]|uniref:Prolactin receptor n=1 Tax=Pleurodeles waltl TaxID=8319 RepID=A0AAV7NGB8_PLEWA|nr:hypothetical protein NDU88_001854 [Pleurodeles waltl]
MGKGDTKESTLTFDQKRSHKALDTIPLVQGPNAKQVEPVEEGDHLHEILLEGRWSLETTDFKSNALPVCMDHLNEPLDVQSRSLDMVEHSASHVNDLSITHNEKLLHMESVLEVVE